MRMSLPSAGNSKMAGYFCSEPASDRNVRQHIFHLLHRFLTHDTYNNPAVYTHLLSHPVRSGSEVQR